MTNIRQLFEQAAAMPPDQRADWLSQACGDDVELIQRVEAMLAAMDDEHFLGDVTAAAQPTMPDAVGECAGDRIGHYKLLQQIGEGGFGTVWMAEQREPVRRRVALKIIKLGMDTRQVIARFEAERQALAMMDHAHIAKVFDAGSTDAGRPYFVMEYINGEPVLQYCDREKLDTRARLRLFTQICHAIQHAHQKGVVHRDIKPSNVLVTLHDGVPVPKVIDFGIAKATTTELTQKTLFTAHRQMIGTPAYMSPEQAEMSGLDIDTRSDVYSLGVLLYELLTGTTPFSQEDLLQKGMMEMLRVIREEEPHKPSTRLSSLGPVATKSAEQRQSDPRRLGTLLRNDLDWIVMKCLEKDRKRRYATAVELAADVQRHLDDEPVLAGPPTATYKLSKFIKRNRGLVAGVSAFIGLLVVALTVLGGLYRWADTERTRNETLLAAERERNAEALAGMTQMLSGSGVFDQNGIQPGSTTRLDLATSDEIYFDVTRHPDGTDTLTPRWIDAGRDDDPGGQIVRVLSSEAVYWTQLGMEQERQRARELDHVARFQARQLGGITPQLMGGKLRQSILEAVPTENREALLAQMAPVNFTDIALQALQENLFEQSIVAIDREFASQPLVRARLLDTAAGIMRTLGLLDAAHSPQSRALDIRIQELGPQHPDTLTSRNALGLLLRKQLNFDDALPHYEAALQGRRATLGPQHPGTLESLNNMGTLLQAMGRTAEAEPYQRDALQGRRAVFGPEHLETLQSLHNLGTLLMDTQRLEEAEELLREHLKIGERVLPEHHPQRMAGTHNLGMALLKRSKRAEAESYLRRAMEARREALGDRHPDTLLSMYQLADLLVNRGAYAEAESLHRGVLAAHRAMFGSDHTSTLNSLNSLAGLLRHLGKSDEAEALFSECLEARRRLLGDDAPATLLTRNDIAALHFSQGRFKQAEEMFAEVLAGRRRVLGDDHRLTLQTMSNLGIALMRQQRYGDAEPLVRESAAHRTRTLGADHADTLVSLGTLAAIAEARSNYAEAQDLFEQVLAGMRRELGTEHRFTMLTMGNLGRVLMKQGRFEAADPYLRDSLQARTRVLGENHPDVIDACSELGRLRAAEGRWEEAEALLRTAAADNATVRGEAHASTALARSELAVTLAALDKTNEALQLALDALRSSTASLGGDDWRLAVHRCRLGRVRWARQEWALAERSLSGGYESLVRTRTTDDFRVQEAVGYLVDLYEAWEEAEPGAGHAATAEAWRSRQSGD